MLIKTSFGWVWIKNVEYWKPVWKVVVSDPGTMMSGKASVRNENRRFTKVSKSIQFARTGGSPIGSRHLSVEQSKGVRNSPT